MIKYEYVDKTEPWNNGLMSNFLTIKYFITLCTWLLFALLNAMGNNEESYNIKNFNQTKYYWPRLMQQVEIKFWLLTFFPDAFWKFII